jgi:hypothetical protein
VCVEQTFDYNAHWTSSLRKHWDNFCNAILKQSRHMQYAIWGPTKERCSLSNDSLANSRIINAARSPQARLHISLGIPNDTPLKKIRLLKTAIAEYMKARHREWLSIHLPWLSSQSISRRQGLHRVYARCAASREMVRYLTARPISKVIAWQWQSNWICSIMFSLSLLI